jgi:hypothetical protein
MAATKKASIPSPKAATPHSSASTSRKNKEKVIAQSVREEITGNEETCYECATEVEEDQEFDEEMQNWDALPQDDLEDETW